MNSDSSTSLNAKSPLEKFALEQMSLTSHMKDVKNKLKSEFIEIQSQKQLKTGKKQQGLSYVFQKKLEKDQILNNLLGFSPSSRRKSMVPPQKKLVVSHNRPENLTISSKFPLSPLKLPNKRKISLNSLCKSPQTSEILQNVRLKPLFSPPVSPKPLKLPTSATLHSLLTPSHPQNASPKKKPRSNFQKIKAERLKSYNSIVKNIENRQKTFARFGFKTDEADASEYLKPILDIFWGNEPKGSMMVVDLWAKKNMRKYLDSCKLTKDKLILSKIASIRQKKKEFLKDSKKLFETAFGYEENTDFFRENVKTQEIKLFNHFKEFGAVNGEIFRKHGVFKKIPKEILREMLIRPGKKDTQEFLKGVFLNAFPGVFKKKQGSDGGFSINYLNSEETKTCSEEKSYFSVVNPYLERFFFDIFEIFISF